jgi:chaperonin GroES
MATATQAKLVPLEDRIVVEKHEAEDKTSGGIILPDNVQEKPQEAIVVSVGAGKKDPEGKLIPIDNLKAGDRVIYQKYSGNEYKIDGKEFLILKASDVLAKLE